MHAARAGPAAANRPGGGGAHPARSWDHAGTLPHHRLVPGSKRVALPERGPLRVRVGPHHLRLRRDTLHRQLLPVR